MAERMEIRQVCPDCGRVEADAGWRGEAESLEVAYLGPSADGAVLAGGDEGPVDVHVPCEACLERRASR